MQNEPLNTAPIQAFIQQVKSADASNAKDVRMDLQSARRLAFCLGEVMTRLEGDLEQLLISNTDSNSDTIDVRVDGGSNW